MHDPPDDAATEVAAFERFVREVEIPLRRALVAHYGSETGRDALAEGLAYAWTHWRKIAALENPAGYLYRISANHAKRLTRTNPPVPSVIAYNTSIRFEPALPWALSQLSARQRTAVLLVHGWGYSQTESAKILGVSESTLRNHVSRGVDRLRHLLGVTADA
jgi:DNA-directed RNA polymerase specialized sigma24 family protein